ncbi:restriction endonuclease subunit S [Pectinatus frisingensis]|uniref:restriction endonuclease subunit S n=1 Tax=Pectinatus frisingensis TaxID=865 RepID=UPI0018C6C4FE|nr:restriction endonuclease subunit S [Pectinatus frisingensis]
MEKKAKVPKLRFPGFTGEWQERKLEEIAQYRNGKAHEKDISVSGKYVVINSKFISTNGNVRKYSNQQIEPLQKNEIAFVLSDVPNGQAIARAFLVDETNKYTLNQRIAGITPNDNIYPYFLYLLMNRNRYFLQFDDGVKQTNLLLNDVIKFKGYYPVYVEQKKIGVFFDNLDNLIALHQRKLTHLQAKKKSLLQKMFPKKGECFPELRFPGFTDAWEQRKLGEVAKFSKGSGYCKDDLVDKGIPIILYGRLYTKYQTQIINVDTFVAEQSNSVYSTGKEVIVPASGETAEDISIASAVMKSGILLGGDLNIVYPYQTLNSVFLAVQLSNGNAKKEMSKRAQGKSVVHLHNADLQEAEISIPRIAEQQQIGCCFEQLDNLITLHQRKLTHLQTQKKALLQQMFV